MQEIFSSIIAGTFNFADLKHYIWTLYLNYNVSGVISSTIASIGLIGGAVMVAVGLISLLYGKKFFTLGKMLVCAAGGYFLGTALVAPFINTIFAVDPMICGGVMALLCGVLAKFLYNFILYASAAVASFVIFFANGFIEIPLFTEGNMIYSLAGVGAVLLILLIMRKNVDRIVTAAFGAFLITFGAINIYDYTVFLPGYENYVKIGAIALLTVLGFAYQYVRRRRY